MTRQKRIVPAILTEDAKALEVMIRQAERFTDYLQIDIMDGHFVPSRSIGYRELMALTIKLNWEAHLMIVAPDDCLESFREAGAQKVVFHYEATSWPQKVISQARQLNLGVGLAVNPETRVPDFLALTDQVDSVLFLTVHPGFYGSPFLPEVLDKIVALRTARPDLEIGVDGGIKEDNIARIAGLGVDTFCVGSAIFRHPEPAEKYHDFLALVQQAANQGQREE